MKFLFDLGGVFFDWNPKYFFKNVFESKGELNFFLNNVCTNEWNIKQDAGRSVAEAEDELIMKFPKYANKIKLYYSNHRKMIKLVYQDSVEILQDLKEKNIPCYALSNWAAETFEGMTDDYPFLKKFDGIIISGQEKTIKPFEDIYLIAVNRYELTPNDTVFIDDNLENIKTAIRLDFKTIHLVYPHQIKNEIYKYLI